MNYPNKILICGLGSIGRFYIRLIKNKWPFIKILILRSGKGKDYEESNCADQVFFNLEDALNSKPDACIISSPASCHLEQALALGRLRVPILIEKPLGTSEESLSSWQELIELNKHIPIFIGYVLRADPCSLFLKNFLSSHQIGTLIEADFFCGSWLPEWRKGVDYRDCVSARKDLGGGVLLELSHEIDLALWTLGKIKIYSSRIINNGLLDISVEDQVLIAGFNENCSSITFRLNFCSKPNRRFTTFRGTSGEIIWDIYNKEITYSIDKKISKSKKFNLSKEDLFTIQLNQFFNAINHKESFLCTLSEGLLVLDVIKESKKLDSKNR